MFEPPVDENGEVVYELVVPFQKEIAKAQIEVEKSWALRASLSHNENGPLFLLCDRGWFDAAAYLREGVLELVMYLGLKPLDLEILQARYKKVFRFESAAVRVSDKEWQRICQQNERFESRQGAIELEEKFTQVWQGHKNYSFVPAQGKGSEKLEIVRNEFIKFAQSQGIELVS